MSLPEWDQWDPMTEHHQGPRHNLHEYFGRQQEHIKPSNSLCIKHIPSDYDWNLVNSIFSTYGNIERCYIKERTGPGPRFGFITYSCLQEAYDALIDLQKNPYGFTVEFAKPRENKDANHNINSGYSAGELKSSSSDISNCGYQFENSSNAEGSRSDSRNTMSQSMKIEVKKTNAGREVSVKAPPAPQVTELNPAVALKSIIGIGLSDNAEASEIPPLGPISDICTYCGNDGNFWCTRCLKPYCSAACQRIDWPRHIAICKPAMRTSAQNGKTTPERPSRRSSGISVEDCISVEKETKLKSVGGKQTLPEKRKPETTAPSIPRNERQPSHRGSVDDQSDAQQQERSRSNKTNDAQGMENSRKSSFKSRFGQPRKRISVANQVNDGQENCTNSSSAEKSPEMPRKSKPGNKQERIHAPGIEEKIMVCAIGSVSLSSDEQVKVTFVTSPDEIWVQREADAEKIVQICKELEAWNRVKQNVSCPVVKGVYCSAYADGMLYRCYITEIFPNETYAVHYIDYGDSTVVKKSDLFYINSKLAKYPCMAVKCRLANVKPVGGAKTWRTEDVELFSHLVLEKCLRAFIVGAIFAAVPVDLLNNDGISIASVLINSGSAQWISEDAPAKKHEVESAFEQEGLLHEVPLVFSALKKDLTVKFIIIIHEVERQQLWVWLQLESILESFQEMQQSLQEATDDISNIVEEGDLAVGYSPEYKTWYRCYVLKRSKAAIRVRYIDFGNEEDITMLCRLTHKQKKVCSPAICICTKEIDANAIEKMDGFSAAVKCVKESSVELSVSIENKTVVLKGLPWYADLIGTRQLTSSECVKTIPREKPKVESHLKEHVGSNSAKKSVPTISAADVTAKCLEDNSLPLNSRTPVEVTWFVSREEVYVHRTADAAKLAALQMEINEWCNLSKNSDYIPVAGDVVCAKFSLDGNWYRCQVLEALPGNTFDVFFIDYGNKDCVKLEDIHQMHTKFVCPKFTTCVALSDVPATLPEKEIGSILLNKKLQLEVINSEVLPKQVIFYHGGKKLFSTSHTLPGIKPVRKDNSSNVASRKFQVWKKKDLVKLDLSDFDDAQVKVLHMDKSKKFFVQLVELRNKFLSMQRDIHFYFSKLPRSDFSPSVDDLVAVYSETFWYRGLVTEVKERTCSVELFDFGYQEEVDKSDVHPLLEKFVHPLYTASVVLDKVPESELSEEFGVKMKERVVKLKFTDMSSEPPKVKMFIDGVCLNDLVQEPLETEQEDQAIKKPSHLNPQPIYATSLKQLELTVGSSIDVAFVHTDGDTFFMQRLEDVEAVNKLSNIMSDYCNKAKPLERDPILDELVCAKSSEDGIWYRAVVSSSCEGDRISVLFLDYGNGEVVTKRNICPFPESFASYPIYCVQVTIDKLDTSKVKLYTQYVVRVVDDNSDLVRVKLVDPDDPEAFDSLSGTAIESGTSSPNTLASNKAFLRSSLRNQTLVPGSSVDVVFVHSDGNTHYLQKLEDAVALNELTVLLQEHCGKADEISDLSMDQLVCAQNSLDSIWFRACVEGVESSGKIRVRYLDFGDGEVVDKSSICSLPDKAKEYPVFCIPVSVFGQDNKQKSVVLNEAYTVIVCESGNSVKILEPEGNSSISRTSLPNHLPQVENDPGSGDNTEENESLPNLGHRVLAPAGISTSEPARANIAAESKTYSMTDCKYVDFKEGANTIIVYSITSMDEIFCAPYVEDNISKNALMVEELTRYYPSRPPYQPQSVAEVTVAKFPDDGNWYRAIVADIRGPQYEVIFVDYGGTALLSKESIRRIEPKHLELPIQAHYCSLGGFVFEEEDKEKINTEVLKILQPFTQQDVYVITGPDEFIIDCPLVRNHLIDKGLAQLS